jgi:hypothetical protein
MSPLRSMTGVGNGERASLHRMGVQPRASGAAAARPAGSPHVTARKLFIVATLPETKADAAS